MDMTDKVVMVTGATNGIGKVAAEEIAKMGAQVIVVGRNPRKTQTTVNEIKLAAGHQKVEGMIADRILNGRGA